MEVVVTPVQSKSDLKAFISLPWKIYRGDRNWVPLLRRNLKNRLDLSKHPFFDSADVALFIARCDGHIVGSIAAINNHHHVDFHKEPVGFFGFFECVRHQEVAEALFSHAADWLKTRNLEIMRGPMSYSTNEECGLLIDGFNRPPVIMMPYNPLYYVDLIEGFGFKKAKDLLAYEITDEVALSDRLKHTVNYIERRRKITTRRLNIKQIHQEVQRVKEIYNSAWERNWGFVPMTDEEIDYMAAELKPIVDPDIVRFAEIDGEAVAFVLSLPDFYQVLKYANGRLFPFGLLKILWHSGKIWPARGKIDNIRILTLGIKEEYRRQGIDALLYYYSYTEGKKKGYRRAELSWILEDNTLMNRALENMGAKVYKRYRIYDYPLGSPKNPSVDSPTKLANKKFMSAEFKRDL